MSTLSKFFTSLVAISSLCLTANAAPVLKKRGIPANVPSFVTQYAPLVWLYSSDKYRPSDIGAQLANTIPETNFAPVANVPNPLTLDNLDALNGLGGASVYLSSKIDGSQNTQQWMYGVTPDSNGETDGAVSCAIIVNAHDDGVTTDVFYMYFYAYNLGPPVLDIAFDDHVGDWEHTMVRFTNGQPQSMWFSQHADGEAFTYGCLEKQGTRPIAYSAGGSHANYAITGKHDHTIPDFNLPDGFLLDYCDQGALWDPTLSAYYYTYSGDSNTFAAYDDVTPVAWLNFVGEWGDQEYPSSHSGQYDIFGEYRYTSGPTGPVTKELQRTNVCPSSVSDCIVRSMLTV